MFVTAFGVRPDSCSALALKIEAQVRAKALARTAPAVRSKRIALAFNSERHKDVARERRWRTAADAFSRAFPRWRTMAEIVAEVAGRYGLTPDDLLGPRRTRIFVIPRHEAIYRIASERPDLSYPQIAKYFSRDHTTLLNAVQQHARRNHLPSLSGRIPQ